MSGFEPLLAAAAGIGGTLIQASAARQQGKADQAAANFNAEQTRIETESREAAQRAEATRRMGTIRANIGKSGVTSAGTPLAVLAESAANAEIDALNTRYTGARQEALYRASGTNARRQGNLMAGASLLSGAAKLY